MVGKDLNKLLKMVKMAYMHFRDFCGHGRIFKCNPQTRELEWHLLSLLCESDEMQVCLFSFFLVSKYSVYLPNVNYSLFQQMSNEVLWGFIGEKYYTHQKYYLFLFYIFAFVKLLLLQICSFRSVARLDSVVYLKQLMDILEHLPKQRRPDFPVCPQNHNS